MFNAGGRFPGDWGFPAWDCKNTGGQHRSSPGDPACWIQPPLPGAQGQYKVPPVSAAKYSKK